MTQPVFVETLMQSLSSHAHRLLDRIRRGDEIYTSSREGCVMSFAQDGCHAALHPLSAAQELAAAGKFGLAAILPPARKGVTKP